MVSGLTAPEVAAALGKTTGAVKALQHRGLASLARVLGLRRCFVPFGCLTGCGADTCFRPLAAYVGSSVRRAAG
jgi:hypothetical protein